MPYHRVLRDVIFDSGYTSKYIVEECNKLGVKIDKIEPTAARNKATTINILKEWSSLIKRLIADLKSLAFSTPAPGGPPLLFPFMV